MTLNRFLGILISLSLLFISSSTHAQDRFVGYDSVLTAISVSSPGLNEKVNFSVNEVSLNEFIRGLGNNYNLNINIDQSVNMQLTTNFSGISVKEVLIFLAKKFNLEFSFIGSIISINSFNEPITIVPPPGVRRINLAYNDSAGTLSFDLSADSLAAVVRVLVNQSRTNIIYPPEFAGKLISGYVQNLPFNSAMEKLAFANGLAFTKMEDGVYLLDKKEAETLSKDKKKIEQGKNFSVSGPTGTSIWYSPDSTLIYLRAAGAEIQDIISRISTQLKKNYFLFSELKGVATVSVDSMSFDRLLAYLLNGTDYTFKKEGEVYLLGNRNEEGLRKTEVFPFQYRTVDKVVDFIPAELKKGIDVKAFPDLNSLILSGSAPKIEELVSYLRDIDRVVPVIQIEVLIVDVRNTNTVASGIEAGIKDNNGKTAGQVFPSLDMSLSSGSVNNIISGINGLGILNLGKVSSSFYLKLKFLEQQGMLKLRSTPKLATLNGHEAKLSIGKTEYYLEIQSSVVGVQNPFPVQSQQYKSVNADLSVTINPIVSGDEQITLDITVKQSNFTERISQTAPPGTITRDFQSMIRMKNEEMVILGGLDENSTSDVGEGVPFLSRIPVLKWFFSSRTRASSKSKLTIFIKPTVLY